MENNFANWTLSKISECCEILDNLRVPINSEERAKRAPIYPYYGANGLQGFIDNFIFDSDLVLIAEDGGYFDEWDSRPLTYIIRGKSWVNNHAHVLQAKKNTTTEWIHYNLVHRNINKFINGGTRAKLNQADLREIPILLPPINEQKKIAEILTSIDRVIELTSLEIDKLQDLKKGMMQELLRKGIRHTKFKDSPVGKIPESWEYGNLGSYVKFSQGVQVDVEEQKNMPCADHVRFIRIVDYTQSTHDLRYILKENAKKGEVELEDVVMVRYGASTGFIGRGIKGAIANNMFTITPQEIITKEYLYYFLKQDLVSQYISNVTAGSAMPAVNFDIVSRIEFYFPTSLEEQIEICQKFSALDKLIEIKNVKLIKSGNLKKGLMNDLLTGKVRVKV